MLTRSEKRKQDDANRQLPLEMLVMIFEFLKINENLVKMFLNTSVQKEKLSILNAGAVNHHWRNGMEIFLKKESSSVFKQWRPDWWTVSNPYCLPRVQIIVEGKVLRFNCPPFVFNGKFQNLTNSICFTGWGENYGNKFPILSEFLPKKVGSQLKSITFSNLYSIPGRALQRILTNTPNVEALTFQNVKILISNEEMNSISLPELRNLAYLRIWEWNDLKLHNWIMEPFKKQLVLIELGLGFKWGGGEQNFPNLRWLKVDEPLPSFLQSELQLPNLQSLSLRCRAGRNATHFERLKQFLLTVGGSLKELHLDFEMELSTSLVLEGNLPAQNLSMLRTFSVNYPTFKSSVKSVKLLLAMFPQLEQLKFFCFFVSGEYDEENAKRIARKHLKKNRYSDICKKLKKVIFHAFGDEGATPFLVECAPFS